MNKQLAGILRGPEHIETAEMPVPEVGPEDALIEVAACGICGSDLHTYHAGKGAPGSLLGHEFSGRIAQCGAKVAALPLGSRVVVNPILARLGLGEASGAFSRFVLLRNPQIGKTIYLLPDSVSDEQGALVEPFSVGLHAVNLSAARPEDKVAIFGAGTIGLTFLAALKARKVRDVVVFDLSPMRLELARTMGASLAANLRERKAVDCLKSAFGAAKSPLADERATDVRAGNADLVFDCAGVEAAFSDGLKSLRFGGRMVVAAYYPGPHPVHLGRMLTRELSVLTSFAYTADEFGQAIELIGRGAVDLKALITHRFPLKGLPEAFKTQGNVDAAVKVMVEIKLR